MVKQKNQHQSLGYASQNTQKMFRLILLSSNCYHESLLYLIKLQSNTFLLSNRGRWQNVAQSFNSISLNFFLNIKVCLTLFGFVSCLERQWICMKTPPSSFRELHTSCSGPQCYSLHLFSCYNEDCCTLNSQHEGTGNGT